MRRFFSPHVPEIGERICLSLVVSHHVLRVTGIAPGESVTLFDGQGTCSVAELIGVEDGCAVVIGIGCGRARAVDQEVWLLAAQTRPAAFDTLVRMTTELGVRRLVPVHSSRVVARGDRKARWQRIATSAVGQSGGSRVPEVTSPLPWTDALAAPPPGMLRFICVPDAPSLPMVEGPVAVLVGPEGGFTPTEIEEAAASGYLLASLGPTVLRADTAGVAAIVRLLRVLVASSSVQSSQ
jgi:16S rRNA (uracil1498-N3)-methyltransferase